MERLLRPDAFSVDPTSPSASKEWSHWKVRFEKFISAITDVSEDNKLSLLINLVSTDVYSYINDAADYTSAISSLEKIYNPKKNVIFARHLLNTCRQDSDQSIDTYFQKLRLLAKDCLFTAVDKEAHENEAIREAFISGLQSVEIRQRLLENDKTDLTDIHSLARSLEVARVQAKSYSQNHGISVNAVPEPEEDDEPLYEQQDSAAAAPFPASKWSCWFCGASTPHASREVCPAFNINCKSCGIKGHLQKVCRRNPNNSHANNHPVQSRKYPNKHKSRNPPSQNISSAMNYLAASPPGLSRSMRKIMVNGKELDALIDSGSSVTFINHSVVQQYGWKLHQIDTGPVSMASSTHISHPIGSCILNVHFLGNLISDCKAIVMNELCADMIIGLDILGEYKSITLELGGEKDPVVISAACGIQPPNLFGEPEPSWKPICVKSRRFSEPDKKFIKEEVERLEKEGKIVECRDPNPWRAQVLVHKGDDIHRQRLVIDYSQTINRYTKLDAYPVPRIDEMVEDISKYSYFTTLDFSSAYHQIPIRKEEQQYTGFEANGKQYMFTHIPFGVTNGVAAFQRIMNDIITKEGLKGAFAYLDNITIGGKDKEEHDYNLKKFLAAAARYDLHFNQSKTVSGVTSIQVLGYLVSHNSIRPDPDRIAPLLNIPAPHDEKSLRSVLGLFSHYSRWVKNFSEKIYPLSHSTKFPLSESENETFCQLKAEIAQCVLATPDCSIPFTIETDASDYAIGATLNQCDQPVAFFSRTLNASERNHHSVEKEAYAVVESIRKWKHYLLGSHFTVVTDQRSVSFMFGKKNHGKIKNDKIARWRIELSPYSFETIHRPGKYMLSADALSRLGSTNHCSAVIDLKTLHDQLCHPGVTRMCHFVRMRNLPFSVDDVKKMTSSCKDCAEIKPRFFKPKEPQHLIKAMAALERLNLDFKGPLPSNSKNKFLLTIIDEYSRYPFAFPCVDVSTKSVINCLMSVFGLFGMSSYVHSDQGSGFISEELKRFLLERGIATSRSSRYNPQGNGQVEKYNGVVWNAIQLALKTRNLPIECWELVLGDALHSIRSLLCTATNQTPHERMFKFPRKSTSGCSLPSWLTENSKALMKRHANHSKYDPIVEEVDVLDVNPSTSHVKTAEGRELIVSNRHLAPIGDAVPDSSTFENVGTDAMSDSQASDDANGDISYNLKTKDLEIGVESSDVKSSQITKPEPAIRRSDRIRTKTVLYPAPDGTSQDRH